MIQDTVVMKFNITSEEGHLLDTDDSHVADKIAEAVEQVLRSELLVSVKVTSTPTDPGTGRGFWDDPAEEWPASYFEYERK